jgi:hypothetical protein
VPLQLLAAQPQDGWPAAYVHGLLIVRADTHVVWRGHGAPADAEGLMQRLRGVPAVPAP